MTRILSVIFTLYIITNLFFLSLTPVWALQQSSLYFLHTDHLGSTVAVTNQQGNLVNQFRYTPFGNVILSEAEGSLANATPNYLYTSQELDQSTNLYNYNARLYNPNTAQFVSADKEGTGPTTTSLNRFAYVFNNPIKNFDPTGNDCRNPQDETCGLIKFYLGKAEQIYEAYGDQYEVGTVTFGGLSQWFGPQERIDPKFEQIENIFRNVAKDTGIPIDVWLALGWRENLLRGDYPDLHGDPMLPSGDGLMTVAFLYHNLHKETNMYNPTEEGWNSNFALHQDPDLVARLPIRFGKMDYEANIYLGAAVYLDALNRMTTPEYADFVSYWRGTGYSDYSIAYAIYNRGPWAIENDPQVNAEATHVAISLFENTWQTTQPWKQETYCPPGGWCGYPAGFLPYKPPPPISSRMMRNIPE